MSSEPIDEKKYFLSVERYFKYHSSDKPIRCVLYDRVSKAYQADNMKAREAVLLGECKRKGLEVIAYYAEIANGKSTQFSKRKVFREAVAQALEREAAIVFTSVDRLVKTAGEKNDPLTKSDMRSLEAFFQDIGIRRKRLMFLIPPGTPIKEVGGMVKKWGKIGKGNPGGRPPNSGTPSERKKEFFPIAKEKREKGFTYREISEEILQKYKKRIPFNTIHNWFKPPKKKPKKRPKMPDFQANGNGFFEGKSLFGFVQKKQAGFHGK